MEETYTYTLEGEDVTGEIILKWILTVNWIFVAQYSDKNPTGGMDVCLL